MNLDEKAAEVFKKYESLPMREKIGVIAQAFSCTSGEIKTSPCYGKWRGTSDIYIEFDNGASLAVGNERTPQAKTVKVQNEYVNAVLQRYNPEIVVAAKETALAALRKREVVDNVIAAQNGLKPYTLLNVELNNGVDNQGRQHMGWYYVTLAVDGKIHAHLDSKLSAEIATGKVSENPTQYRCFAAGPLKVVDANADYVFNNVGFCSTSTWYSLPLADDVLRRAEKVLAERGETPAHKPSIRAQLAAKPIPGDKPTAKTKEREVR